MSDEYTANNTDVSTDTKIKTVPMPMRVKSDDKDWFTVYSKEYSSIHEAFTSLRKKSTQDVNTIPEPVNKIIEQPVIDPNAVHIVFPDRVTDLLKKAHAFLIAKKRIPDTTTYTEFLAAFVERSINAYIVNDYTF